MEIPKYPWWIHALGILLTVCQMLHEPQPGEPQQAFITTLVLLAAVFIASELLRPKPRVEDSRPKGLGDFRVPTATQGRPVPLIFGTVMQEGPNVIWYGDLQQVAITKKVKTGLFSSTKQTVGYKYRLGLQFGVGRGPEVELRRILVGDKEAFSGSVTTDTTIAINLPDFFGGDLGAGGLVGDFTWRTGGQNQPVVDYLIPHQDVDPPNEEVPLYVGTCHGTWEKGEVGNSTNLAPWKFELRRISNGLSLSGNGSVNSGNDMNPMNVAYELFTNTEWGFAFPEADLDLANWISVANVLTSEGNGFSMLLDTVMEGTDLLKEIERQIDGVIFLNHQTGKWQVKLARADYTIGSLKAADSDNILEVKDYSAGSWEETLNFVRTKFSNRANEYADDYGLAHDMANAQIQGGGTVTTVKTTVAEQSYPGIKDQALANQIAWRELRSLSRPLAKATLIVTRDLYSVTPGEVIRWTDADRGFVDLPMRVQRIDYGELRSGEIALDVIQDVFSFRVGSFGDPPETGWTAPADTLVAIPVDEQLAFEAPRALRYRDPDASGEPSDAKIWAAGRQQGPEVELRIRERHAAGAPSGSFFDRDAVQAFMLIGELTGDLASGTGVGTTSFLVTPGPDVQADLEAAFEDDPDVTEKGVDLVNIVMVGDPGSEEFMLVGAAANSGGDVNLTSVHRGVLDTAQRPHPAGTPVYLIFAGGGLADNLIPDTHNVEVKLLPRSLSDTVAEGSANTISFTNDRRLLRPYCPSQVSLNDSLFDATDVDLDALAAGAPETTGVDLDFVRRDYRTGEGLSEITPLVTDAASLFADFPSANSYTTELTVVDDPDGAATALFTVTAISGTQQDMLRIEILANTDGVVPSRMRVELRGRHDEGVLSGLLSRGALLFDFDTVSAALSGQFNFGARAQAVTSNLYTADAAGQHDFTLSSALPGGEDVEYRLNGGSWTQLIAGGGTAGSIAGVVVNDTIEVRHQGTAGTIRKQLDMDAPGSGTDGYLILRD